MKCIRSLRYGTACQPKPMCVSAELPCVEANWGGFCFWFWKELVKEVLFT